MKCSRQPIDEIDDSLYVNNGVRHIVYGSTIRLFSIFVLSFTFFIKKNHI